MIEFSALIAACFAGAAGALAYGYRGQRDMEREQVIYLRKQLEARTNPPPRNDDTRALQRDAARSNVPALVER